MMVPYFIAEVNSSHNGNVDLAKKMIDAAKDAGCDCVKFQSWSANSLYSKTYYKNNPITRRIVEKFSLGRESLCECAEYCRNVGIGFSSTPYSEREVDDLVDLDVPYIKIASMEIDNLDFLLYIAKKRRPIVLSTGMADLNEITCAVEALRGTGCSDLTLLHCVSIYPADPATIHLNNIKMLKEKFPDCRIGFSDHTVGIETACAAVALGAEVIEKHLTLDKTRPGMDNNMAMEHDEFKVLVRSCRNVYAAMGNYDRVVSDAECEQRKKMRRSVIATRDLRAGEVIAASDLSGKRPGDGIPLSKKVDLIGRKLRCDVEADTLVRETDVF